MPPASNATLTQEDSPPATTGAAPPVRRGGLIAMPKGVMSPVFALLVAFLALDVVLLVSPYYVYRFTDNLWGSAERMEFLAKAMAAALTFGFLASIAAERRNHSPWAFLLGHAGFWVALSLAAAGYDVEHARAAALWSLGAGFLGCVIVVLMTATPRAAPPPVRGLLLALCRVTGACGNIWFGIALMAAIALTVGTGTMVESVYNAQVAQYVIYRSPWFGALFFTAGLSMLSATFRKYPFRLEQAGWLTVHSGLALVVIGSMASFLTKVEGEVQIEEGQRVDGFQLSSLTRLDVSEVIGGSAGHPPRLEPVIHAISDFDLNPADHEPNRVLRSDRAPLTLTVDRFFSSGAHRVTWHDDGPEPRAGIALDVLTGPSEMLAGEIRLEESGKTTATFEMIAVDLVRASKRHYEALVREAKPQGLGPRNADQRAVAGVLRRDRDAGRPLLRRLARPPVEPVGRPHPGRPVGRGRAAGERV
jgi:hypothetical protein